MHDIQVRSKVLLLRDKKRIYYCFVVQKPRVSSIYCCTDCTVICCNVIGRDDRGKGKNVGLPVVAASNVFASSSDRADAEILPSPAEDEVPVPAPVPTGFGLSVQTSGICLRLSFQLSIKSPP